MTAAPSPAVSDRLRARLEAALAERGIDPDRPAQHETPQPQPALEAAQRRLPYDYRDAVADHPDVTAWVRTTAANAEAPNTSSLQPSWGGRGRREIAHGPSLLLWGPTGSGKTHQAFGAVRALTAAGCGVRWYATTAPDFYGQMRPGSGTEAEPYLQRLMRVPLLLLDDLGVGKSSEWTEEVTFRLIHHRCQHRLPTLITTNLSPVRAPGQPVLRDKVGDRVLSRLSGMCQPVHLTGPDRRFPTT